MIPFNTPFMPELSKQYALEAMESDHQQGDGRFTKQASKLISDLTGGGHVLLTPSCTHALEMASMLANLGPGDEVILPSYTFTSAATAVTKFGATPIFVDIEMDTKGIDVNQVRDAITPKTKAVSWVNYAGVAPDIEALQSLAKQFNLLLIEDNAHGLGGTYKGDPLGSFGDFATQSFHATKNIQCGEGGALVINNPKFIERAEIIREKGTNRSKFLRGEVQKYQWVDQGSSYLLAEVLAAILTGQLLSFGKIQEYRGTIWQSYFQILSRFSNNSINYKNLMVENSINPYHISWFEVSDDQLREKLITEASKQEIGIVPHYQSLGNSIFAKKHLRRQVAPNSLKTTNNLLRLPMHLNLKKNDISIIESLLVDIFG